MKNTFHLFASLILVLVTSCKKDTNTSQLDNVDLKVVTLNKDTVETTHFTYGEDMMLAIKLINNTGKSIKLSTYSTTCEWLSQEDFLFVYKTTAKSSMGFVPAGRPYVYPVNCLMMQLPPDNYYAGEYTFVLLPWKENPENKDLTPGSYFTHFTLSLKLEDGSSRRWDLRRDFEVQ